MDNISIVVRALKSEEVDLVNNGFDQLYIDEGVALESTESVSLVALDDVNFLGCCSGLIHKNGKEYSGWFHLTDLYVDKPYRNCGIGSGLLNALEEKLDKIGVRTIWLWTSGEATLRLYQRHGYTQFTEMENWYSDGSSRVGMRKNLKSISNQDS